MELNIGDWVIGKSKGTMFKGWIEDEARPGVHVIHIVECDDKVAIGKSVPFADSNFKKIKDVKDNDFVYDHASVLNMIDASLIVGDKESFLHFTSMLRSINKPENQKMYKVG